MLRFENNVAKPVILSYDRLCEEVNRKKNPRVRTNSDPEIEFETNKHENALSNEIPIDTTMNCTSLISMATADYIPSELFELVVSFVAEKPIRDSMVPCCK